MARFCESEVMPLLFDSFLRSCNVCVSYLSILLLFVISIGVQAQDLSSKSETSTTNATKPARARPAKLKLTPEQEKALRLLDDAQASAPGLQPGMQAFVLFQVANTYEKFNKPKSRDLLQQAFLASLSMDDDPDHCTVGPACVKSWMQKQILGAILKDQPGDAEKLMVRAETPVRNAITGELVQKYVEAKNFSHAEDLLTQIADQPGYPYAVATTLILGFPKDQSAECQRVFSQAFANFNQYGTTGIIGTQDFGSLILQTFKRLPPPLVLEAIDKMLDEAKSNEGMKNLHMTLGSKSNDASLNSLYEVRLFQLLPVLEQLDSSKAESLLRDNVQVKNDLKTIPDGMGAFEPGYNGGKGESPSGIGISFGGDSNNSQFQARMEAQAQMARRQDAIENEASENPQQAIAEAMALPISGLGPFDSPRGRTLAAIAANQVKKNPTAAKAALDELMKLADQLTYDQVQPLIHVPKLYLDLGDPEDAKSAIKMLSKKAEAAYAKDNDADDPNQAFKGAWPSTNLWQECVKTAGKISPQLVQDILADIPDADIVGFEKVVYAKTLLGIDIGYSVSVQHKNGSNFSQDFGK